MFLVPITNSDDVETINFLPERKNEDDNNNNNQEFYDVVWNRQWLRSLLLVSTSLWRHP